MLQEAEQRAYFFVEFRLAQIVLCTDCKVFFAQIAHFCRAQIGKEKAKQMAKVNTRHTSFIKPKESCRKTRGFKSKYLAIILCF